MMKRFICVLCLLCMLQDIALAAISVRIGDTAALLTRAGEEIVAPYVYTDIRNLSEGAYIAEQSGLWALVDASGAALTDFRYDEIRVKSGAIIVKQDGGYGVIDRVGNEILPAIRSAVTPADQCYLVMDDDGAVYRLDADGTMSAEGPNALRIGESVRNGRLLFQSSINRRFGYLDENAEVVIEPVFDYAEGFQNGLAKVTLANGCGAIDPNGAYVLPPIYSALEIAESGFILAVESGKGATVFDLNGEPVAEYTGGDVTCARVGKGYLIRDSEAVRVYDESGNLILEALPDTAVYAGMDGALIVSEGTWGERCVHLADSGELSQDLFPLGRSEGKAVYARLEVPAARYTNDLLNEVQISTDMDSARYGLTDAHGQALTGCDYISLEFLEDDRFLARTDDAWQMIDAHGSVIWKTPAQTETSG